MTSPAPSAALLRPDSLQALLRLCGYRPSLLRNDFPFDDHLTVPLVGFAQSPVDSRSACVAVLSTTSEPRQAVEACRLLGAPLVFVCIADTLQWWKQGTQSAELLESIPAQQVANFFKRHADELSPSAIYRAKTWGRFQSQHQLAFVDLGLMPLVEEEVGRAIGRLIERNVVDLKRRLGWHDVSSSQGHWLLKVIFWLLSGKILRDKEIPNFQDLDLHDVRTVFARVASHYGSDPIEIESEKKLEALNESARVFDEFSRLTLTTTEALAYVYENTLVSKDTRSSLGTHSTPSFLVDYIVGNLADWIEEIPVNDRSVFEPACGHAAFLVSAMRLLTELLPPEKATPSRRGPYLRRRLHGTEIDAFALELARLSLTLTDIPNPDGWDLKVEDMFVGNTLSEQARRNTILLANPPFGNFTPQRRDRYRQQGTNIGVVNQASEMLRRAIPELRSGSVFGVVVPQTFLHSAYGENVRQLLVETCELAEISLFPDKVFSFSDAESAVLLGRRRHRSKFRRASVSRLEPDPNYYCQSVRYRRVREHEMEAFRTSYQASTGRPVRQARFSEEDRWNLRLPELESVWQALSHLPPIAAVATLGQGLFFRGKDLPSGVPTSSNEPFRGAQPGYTRLGRGIQLHEHPTRSWLNLADEAIDRRVAGATIGVSQVLLNYAPVSRGPWRLKALIDRAGHPVTNRFITVRPNSCSIEVLWAILNSPVANAYAFVYLGKRDNIVGKVRNIPFPSATNLRAVEMAVAAYLDSARANTDATILRTLMLEIDAEVLKAYALPVQLERSLLDLFSGYRRVGVPFEMNRYFPRALSHPMRLADYLKFSEDWERTNRERHTLVHKELERTLSDEDKIRLDALQAYADYHLDRVAPRPFSVLDEVEGLIVSRKDSRERQTE